MITMRKRTLIIISVLALVIVLSLSLALLLANKPVIITDIEDTDTPLGMYTGEAEKKIFYVNTISDIRGNDFLEGTIIRTLGGQSPGDGQASEFEVIPYDGSADDGVLIIDLGNGMMARMLKSGNIAYVEQFGAVGDGVENDTKAIQAAMDSSYDQIIFSGTYKVMSTLTFRNGNKTLLGLGGSKIITEADYKDKTEWLFSVRCENVTFENMTIETREPSTVTYKTQVALLGASGVTFQGCTLNVFPAVAGKEYANIDLYSGWHDVVIQDCTLIIESDGPIGSNLLARDFFNEGVGGLLVDNNYMYKYFTDEIIWVYASKQGMSDLTFTNNTLISEQRNAAVTPIALTIEGSSPSSRVTNVLFEGNEVSMAVSQTMFKINRVDGCIIRNNSFTMNKVGPGTSGCYAFRSTFEETNTNVVMENNEITINAESTGIARLFDMDADFVGNKVTINGKLTNAFGSLSKHIAGNDMTINGNVSDALCSNINNFTDNTVVVNGSTDKVFQYYSASLTEDAYLTDNNINVRESTANNSQLLMINSSKFNGHKLMFGGNTVVLGEMSEKISDASMEITGASVVGSTLATANKILTDNAKDNIAYAYLTDATDQSVYFYRNTISGYRPIIRNKVMFYYVDP